MRTVEEDTFWNAAFACGPLGGFTGPTGAGGNPENTSGNPNRFRNFRISPSTYGGFGSTRVTPRTIAEPRTSRATAGNGPFERLNPMNHAVRTTTKIPINDPPAASTIPNRDPRVARHTRAPISHPTASPRPAIAKKPPK